MAFECQCFKSIRIFFRYLEVLNDTLQIMTKLFLFSILLGALHLTAFTQPVNTVKKTGIDLIGSPLPAFRFQNMNGQIVDSKSFKGKPMLLNLWFTTCVPCIDEMPELNRLKEKYKGTDIVFLSMTFESKEKVLNFLKKERFDFEIIPEVMEYCNQLTETYPLNVFVNRQGMIENMEGGMPYTFDFKTNKLSEKVDPSGFERALLEIK